MDSTSRGMSLVCQLTGYSTIHREGHDACLYLGPWDLSSVTVSSIRNHTNLPPTPTHCLPYHIPHTDLLPGDNCPLRLYPFHRLRSFQRNIYFPSPSPWCPTERVYHLRQHRGPPFPIQLRWATALHAMRNMYSPGSNPH
jgi:hypothetical protein